MSAQLLKRLASVKSRMEPDEVTIINPRQPGAGFTDDTWPAECARRLAAAKARGERIIEIQPARLHE
jgi:hypothetical protein